LRATPTGSDSRPDERPLAAPKAPKAARDVWLRNALFALAAIWTGLAALFAFSDLWISRVVVAAESPLAVLTEYYGEIPGLAVISFALFVVHRDRKLRWWGLDLLMWVFMIGLTSLVLYYASSLLYYRITGSFEWLVDHGRWLWLALAVVILALHLAMSGRKFSDRVDRFARTAVGIAVVNVLLFVHLGKPLWGRVRFYDLDPTYSDFTPWYLPQGVTGGDSFPSGHAALGWMLLPLILLVRGRNRPTRVLTAAVVVAWGLAVAIGRVVRGAHYASDVLFSTGVAFAAFAFWYRYYYLKPERPRR